MFNCNLFCIFSFNGLPQRRDEETRTKHSCNTCAALFLGTPTKQEALGSQVSREKNELVHLIYEICFIKQVFK